MSCAGVPSTPTPPKLDKAGVNSIHLSWSKPESKGGKQDGLNSLVGSCKI